MCIILDNSISNRAINVVINNLKGIFFNDYTFKYILCIHIITEQMTQLLKSVMKSLFQQETRKLPARLSRSDSICVWLLLIQSIRQSLLLAR